MHVVCSGVREGTRAPLVLVRCRCGAFTWTDHSWIGGVVTCSGCNVRQRYDGPPRSIVVADRLYPRLAYPEVAQAPQEHAA